MRRRSLHTTPLPVLRVHESLLLCAKALQKASHAQHTATLSHPCIAHTPNRLATPRAHMRRPTHTCLAHSLALPLARTRPHAHALEPSTHCQSRQRHAHPATRVAAAMRAANVATSSGALQRACVRCVFVRPPPQHASRTPDYIVYISYTPTLHTCDAARATWGRPGHACMLASQKRVLKSTNGL